MEFDGGITMYFPGFTDQDFQVFSIDGLDERMMALKTLVRPKLELLGKTFAPDLSTLTGDEMFEHVAKHARRTKNPPSDTWVAFSNSKRGYKMLPHFQIGLWGTHLFIWYAVIYEAPKKKEIGQKLEQHLATIQKQIPSHFVWSGDHMKPDATKMETIGTEGLQQLIIRLQTVKKAEVLCGRHIPRAEVIKMNGEDLINLIHETFVHLMPLYHLQ